MFDSCVGSRVAHASLLLWYLRLPLVLQNLQWTWSWCIDCCVAALLVRNRTSKDARYDCQYLYGHAAVVSLSRYVSKHGSKHRIMTDLD
jgi:hypothetical protein